MSEYVGLRQGKVHDRREISEYYCGGCGYPVTDHDSYCRECGGALHEGMDKSRWHELFGTPERAARTLIAVRGECESGGPCYPNCPFGDAPACPSSIEPRDYDALLEWLKGDA